MRLNWLQTLGLLVLLSAIAIAVEIFLPYRPTTTEATQAVKRAWDAGRTYTLPDGTRIERHDWSLLTTIDHVPRAVVVLDQYQTWYDGVQTSHCTDASYVTRHWLSGPRSYSGVPMVCYSDGDRWPITISDARQQGTYLLVGGSADPRLTSVRGQWSDGRVENVPIQEGAFFFFRDDDDLHLEWVVGVDAEGRELAETRRGNEVVAVTLRDYDTLRQVTLNEGIILMGAYHPSASSRQCLQLSYLTAENAQRTLSGEAALTGQTVCVTASADRATWPSVSTVVAGTTVVGGIVLDEAIQQVRLEWSDGSVQTVAVDQGFYLAQHPSGSVTLAAWQGLPADSTTAP